MNDSHEPSQPLIRLGISACLLGQRVRYDGGHRFDPFLVQTLGRYVEWVPVCPELELGLGVPRETLHLVGDPRAPRLVGTQTGHDLTEDMLAWSRRRLDELEPLELSGFVFKKGSPSSGLRSVPVYDGQGMPSGSGSGIFAGELVKRWPLLPVEEEGRLEDMRLRESFIERVSCYYRWREMLTREPTPAGLVRFHTAHKMTLLAHSTEHYRSLGRMVAEAGSRPWAELATEYAVGFMNCLKVLATPGKHANVMQHLVGYLKDTLAAEDKAELLSLIDEYRRGLLPLVVPLTLLRHHLSRHLVPEWVNRQVYLNPCAAELMLRNHA
jgi:uncharacterized protein YbgA (DUF1722 family)/uncharacterized protein YbbK (DUF523 family)